jgi:glutamate/aspartate transport system substrate-binding protein
MMRLKLILTATALCLSGHATIAQELTGTLEKIRSTGIIAIGHRESSIPFSYYDKNEKVVGYAVDLCYIVADAVKVNLGLAKLEIKLVPITPSLRVPSILSEKIDLACETMTNNVERQKVVAFSSTYFVAANRFVSKVAANLRTLNDLKGKTVVSTIGSTNLKQISELNAQRHLGLTILAAKDNFEAFRMLESCCTAPWRTRRRPPTMSCQTRRCRSSRTACCSGATIPPSRRWLTMRWRPSIATAISTSSMPDGFSIRFPRTASASMFQ